MSATQSRSNQEPLRFVVIAVLFVPLSLSFLAVCFVRALKEKLKKIKMRQARFKNASRHLLLVCSAQQNAQQHHTHEKDALCAIGTKTTRFRVRWGEAQLKRCSAGTLSFSEVRAREGPIVHHGVLVWRPGCNTSNSQKSNRKQCQKTGSNKQPQRQKLKTRTQQTEKRT